MHELYIAECILKSVSDSLPPGISAQTVEEVRVDVGQLDAVVPDTLQFLFDAIKGNNGMPNAALILRTVEVRCRCRDCAREFGLDLPIFICPHCNSTNVELLQGRGITLTGILVKDDSGDEDGNTGHS